MTIRLLRGVVILAVALSFTHVSAADTAHKIVRIGFVGTTSPSTFPSSINAFWDRLRELGYVEGQNLKIESRWAQGRLDRLPALMAEMVERKVDVIVTWGTPAVMAAARATSTIPIVFLGMGDPVGSGIAASLARPGGNITGFSAGWADIRGKWLEFLQEAVPRLSTVAVIANPDNTLNRKEAQELESVAPTRGLKVLIIYVREAEALDRAFEQARRGAQAVLVFSDPLTMSNTRRIVALAAKHRLPDMYVYRDSVHAGGLMAYGSDLAVVFRRSANYIDKILNGARPADLPIEQPTQYFLAVNLKTAKTLGLTVPQSILLRADEVIR